MPEASNTQEQAYLPVEVAGQLYGIPLTDVVAVHRLRDDTLTNVERAPRGDRVITQVPTIDLRHLLGRSSSPQDASYAVIVSTGDGDHALLVDAIKPSAVTSQIYPLPGLVASAGWLFRGVARGRDALIPILDAPHLVAQLLPSAFHPGVEGYHGH